MRANLTAEQRKKLELLQLRRQLAEKLRFAFDPKDVGSRPTPAQMEIINSNIPINFVVGSNRSGKCLITGTKIATPKGPVAIEDIRPGDTVYSEHGEEIKVVGHSYQGKQKVAPLVENKFQIGVATLDHRWLTSDGRVIHTQDFNEDTTTVATCYVKSPLGKKAMPTAYALGALLGDGCSTEQIKSLAISSKNDIIPNKVARCFPNTFVKKLKGNNYTYIIESEHKTFNFPHYAAWCKGKKAHEKIADIDTIKEWDRQSVLQFLAGLIDTDGSIYFPNNRAVFRIGMQAKDVILAAQWALLALWQIQVPVTIDDRDKYVNGPLFNLRVGNGDDIKRMWEELAPFLIPEKGVDVLEKVMSVKSRSSFKARMRTDRIRVEDTWDIEVDSDTHLFLLANGRVSHNTALGGRIITWWFNGHHPYMEKPEAWGDHPIKILMMGQDTRNIQFEIFAEKIKPFIGIEGVDYKVKRDGGNISAVTNLHNGNVIVFMSHSDAEQARRRGQGFTAQIVWLDEMPSVSSIVTELSMRVLTTGGFMYATFTPLIRNDEIRKIVDSCDGLKSKKWLISILDNPAIDEDKRAELISHFRSMSGSEAEFRARMYGDWLSADTLVFKYDASKNFLNPTGYDPRIWPHVVVVDPAASSIAGLSVWARHPSANVWWCVKAKYLKGQAFSELVMTVEEEIKEFNIVKRVCDCNPSGFYHEAYLHDIKYVPISDKQYNKENMIDACNKALMEETVYLTDGAQPLIEELTVCARHEDDPSRIIKASKYHTADTFRYFVHAIPKYEGPQQVIARDEEIRYNWKQRLKKESEAYHAAKAKEEKKQLRRQRRRRW